MTPIMTTMKRLGVNIDHVATLRQARGTPYPDPLDAAERAIAGGADQITVHLREDRRHIQDGDLDRLKAAVNVPLNLEMAAVPDITNIACAIKPDVATLVPERREELTTEGGLKVRGNSTLLPTVKRLKDAGIRVSLFIDPALDEVAAAQALAVDAVEFHTGRYCEQTSESGVREELARLVEAVDAAHALGLDIAAGHGLHYDNVQTVVRAMPLIEEYNIGHSIVARAVFTGMTSAVQDMKRLLEVS